MAKEQKKSGKSSSKKMTKVSADAPKPSSMFETLWNRRKFNILGKKRKGEGIRIGQSRSLAIEKRKKTILQEFKQRHKRNTFIDHRFGEHDDTLTEEEKQIIRFQHEHQAQIRRKSKFTLEDSEESNDEVLTHRGTALSSIDHFNEEISGDEDDMEDLNEETVKGLHFGGGQHQDDAKGDEGASEGNRHRSKKEIMEEVIAKSKFYKALKVKEKEEDANLQEKLDNDFAVLSQSQAFSSLVHPKKTSADKDGVKTNATAVPDKKFDDADRPDDYAKLMKEMIFDMRAHASDRLKTPEEIAKEERDRLEELETQRQKRMLGKGGSESDEDSDEAAEEKNGKRGKRKRKKGCMEISGDDLGENFMLDEQLDDVQKLNSSDEDEDDDSEYESEDGRETESEDEDEDEVESEDEEGGKAESEDEDGSEEQFEGEEESEDNADMENEAFEEEKEHNAERYNPSKALDADEHPSLSSSMSENKKLKCKQSKVLEVKHQNIQLEDGGLPYIIDAPQTVSVFRQLVDSRKLEDLELAIKRIRTCNAISLSPENRKKMQIFYNVLLLYFKETAGRKSIHMDKLNILIKPLIEMSFETPYFAATCAQKMLVHMQRQLSEKLKNAGEYSCWPSTETLLLLRLWSMIFPPSDFRHAVMTPATLLTAEYLVCCPVKSGRDLAIGSFVCALLLSVMKHAKRYCPEAINFLLALLLSALPLKNISRTLCPVFMRDLMGSSPWLLLSSKGTDVRALDFVAIVSAEESSPMFGTDNFRAAVLHVAIQTLKGFTSLYQDLPSFPEIFNPFLSVLREIRKLNKLPEELEVMCVQTQDFIQSKSQEQENFRQPLRMRFKKPIPIKQFNPKFEENYVKGKDYDPDRERSEKKKLLRKLKQEAKGAARELRKDNYFLNAEKEKEKAAVEDERNEKYRKAMAFLQDQEAAFKSGQLGGKRKRR